MAKTVKTDISRNDQAIQDPFSQKLIKNHQKFPEYYITSVGKEFRIKTWPETGSTRKGPFM